MSTEKPSCLVSATQEQSTPLVPRSMLLTFFLLVSCFALWGLLNNMTDNLVPAFQKIFTMDQSKAGLVQVAFYGAYAVLAIFASILVEEFSYRIGVLIGLGIYIVGALCYIPACIGQNFEIYFIAIFIVAGGCSILETTCNPYVLSLGSQATAVRRLNFAQAFNPVGSLLGIILAQQLILSHLNPATAEERGLMDPAQLKDIINTELFWVCAPYVGLCLIAAIIWGFFLVRKKQTTSPQELQELEERKLSGETRPNPWLRVLVAMLFSIVPLVATYFLFPDMDKVLWILCGMVGPFAYLIIMKDYREMLVALLKRPRYWTGVIAQFFYVGVQIAAWTCLNVYCQKELNVTPATAAHYYTISIILLILARWTTTYFMKLFNPASIMTIFAIGAIACCAGVMYIPSTVIFTVSGLDFSGNIIALIAMSGFMSLMFPTIYGIALGSLGKEVKLGAAGLIMAILGGAIITPWMSGCIDNGTLNFLVPGFSTVVDTANNMPSSAAVRSSFLIPAICFAVVLVYSLVFRKPATPDSTKD